MKILIIGSGGREHAMAWHMKTYGKHEVLVFPGNDGIKLEFECFPGPYSEARALEVARNIQPHLIMIGPERPLVDGIVDVLIVAGFKVFGPSRIAARLEGSKSFMKLICKEAGINTAKHTNLLFDTHDIARIAKEMPGPWVLKQDGLAGGKGVVICNTEEELYEQAEKMVNHSLFFVEEFIEGEEVSIIGICDGEDAVLFPPVRDYKRLLQGNFGPNTGGMGAAGPLFLPDSLSETILNSIFRPALKQMSLLHGTFRGFLYAGLMVRENDVYLLEFNVRMGDPEAQCLFYGIEEDLTLYYTAISHGHKLESLPKPKMAMKPTVATVLAASGYPGAPITDVPIIVPGILTGKTFWGPDNGGRLLTHVTSGKDIAEAAYKCRTEVEMIDCPGSYFRPDIGEDLLSF